MKHTRKESERYWHKDTVVYQIHVKSFRDGSGDGVGDFTGVTKKLDYLQELGITCIWLQPFFPSPLRDDGYDIADFRAVHPAYGSVDDFRRFLEEAHGRGIRVLAELVLGHTSDQHPWFQAARRAPPGSSLRNFYVWNDTRQTAPNWTWDELAHASYRHQFFEHEPDLNWGHPLVRSEMHAIMRFWLDMEVDGLCVGALAWARENREWDIHGTLREIRRDLDEHYPGRILLGGLNRRPAEVLPYFGSGDECHLALHGSLVPRLVMALRQEDRHPITDVMKETPSLPDACQWVLFLRNHDELALSSMSEEDRDYLVKEYAADPRMCRPQGILRRLAPLMDNSRPQIELMFSLLFSLPGTPIIYYGDEIGMGDNIFLGDRAAVRTPMQWSAAACAGFSEADGARLATPPNSDPVYGYQAVNVESQLRDPSSLLHWMQRLIALRRRMPVLGRGDIKFLPVSNRKILAYVRRTGDDIFLAIANLSRAVQPVELDLGDFAGRIPVEVFGQTAFPRIGSDPYFFTLGPHSFYWFQLHRKFETVAVRLLPVVTEEIKEVPSLSVAGTWHDLLEGDGWNKLAKLVSPYLMSKRWFGAKTRSIQSIHIADWAALPLETKVANEPNDNAELSFSQCAAVFVLLEIRFEDTTRADLYVLSLSVLSSAEAARRLSSLHGHVLARLSTPGEESLLIDALADDAFSAAVIGAIADGREFPARFGRLRARPTSACHEVCGERAMTLKAKLASATSSNSLVIWGRRLLLKLYRHPDVGINPDLEIGRFLTEKAKFASVPWLAGALEYEGPDRQPGTGCVVTVAILQQLVANQGDGWQHAIDELASYFERASSRRQAEEMQHDRRTWIELADDDPPPHALEAIGHYLQSAATLGKRTAELHLALATGRDDPAFAPQPLEHNDLMILASEACGQAQDALAALGRHADRLPESLRVQARHVLDDGPAILEQMRRLPNADIDAAKIRCHGDYHLGQVLRVEGDFVIIDFEGEPVHTIAQRRAKQSPLKDVAGMLRSFNYAAYAGLFAFTQHRPADFEPLIPWADLWQTWTSAVFLKAYRVAVGTASFVPGDPKAFLTLLRFFVLDKALYELIYELNNRPDWVRIPIRGILSLRSQGSGVRSPAGVRSRNQSPDP